MPKTSNQNIQDTPKCSAVDFNGHMETSKGVSTKWLALVSEADFRTMPLARKSKRHFPLAFLALEAEIATIATGLKSEGFRTHDCCSAMLCGTSHL